MKEILALWMSALFILIPIVSSDAAASLSISKFSGNDNIPSIARGNDQVVAEAQVYLPNDNQIDRNQLHIQYQGLDSPADSCAIDTGTTWKCLFQRPIVNGFGSIDYTFSLRTDAGTTTDSVTKTLLIDREGPTIQDLSTPDIRVKKDHVSVSYSVTDTAGGSTSGCAGVDHVELYLGGVAGSPIKTVTGKGTCDESGTFDEVSFGKTGAQDLCAIAYDRLGQPGQPYCTSVDISAGPPQIQRVNVTDSYGDALHFAPAGGITADLVVTINGAYSTNIWADLSGVTGNAGDTQVTPSSVLGDDVKLVRFEGVSIKSAAACSFKIHVEDDVGNVAERSLDCGLAEDNSPPELVSLTSPDVDTPVANGTSVPYIGKTGQVIATINENGAGLNNRYVFLDASAMGLSPKLRASNCSNTGDSWTCVFDVKPVRAGMVQLHLSGISSDDVGNTFSSNPLTTFVVDLSAPTGVTVISAKPIHGAVDIGNFTVRGDTVEFKVQADSFSGGIGDFHEFGGNVSDCQRDGDVCTYTTYVDITGPATAHAYFTFFDQAGNNITISYPWKIFGVRNETNPNYWTNSVTCSPELVDRSITKLLNTRVYCAIHLASTTPSITTGTIDFDPQKCVGGVDKLSDLGLSNNYAGSTDPLMYVLLSASDYPINTLDFTCPLSITSRINDFVTAYPEQENVTVSIKFFSRPQADLAKSVMDKFKQAKKDALKLDGLIGTLTKIVQVAEKICQIRSMITNALNAIDSVMALMQYIQSGALNVKTTIPMLLAGCSAAGNTPGAVSGVISAGLSSAYGIADSAAAKVKEDAAKAAASPTSDTSAGGKGTTKQKPISGKLTDVCDAQKALEAKQKAQQKQTENEQDQANKVVDQAVDRTFDEAEALLKACEASGEECPGYAGVQPCRLAIKAYNEQRSAWGKIESARSKMCNNKEGLVQMFKCTVDKFAAPFCNFVNCDWGPSTGGESGGFSAVSDFMGNINPNNYLKVAGIGPGIPIKQSLVWSVASLCLPGIIENVDKYRQINCQYALCIGQDVVQRGLPITSCEKKKEENMCNFVWGQVFNSIPFLGTVQSWIDTLKQLLTNPVAAITFVLGQYCKAFCAEGRSDISPMQYKICAFPKTLDALAAVANDIKSIINPDFWKLGETQCDQLKSFNPVTKKANATTTTTTTTATGASVLPGLVQTQ